MTEGLQQRLGHRFRDAGLLEHALTHRSAADPRRQMLDSNERLEFLGDRVLGLCMAEWLAERFPQEREGDLGHQAGLIAGPGPVHEGQKIRRREPLQDSLRRAVRPQVEENALLPGPGHSSRLP